MDRQQHAAAPITRTLVERRGDLLHLMAALQPAADAAYRAFHETATIAKILDRQVPKDFSHLELHMATMQDVYTCVLCSTRLPLSTTAGQPVNTGLAM